MLDNSLFWSNLPGENKLKHYAKLEIQGPSTPVLKGRWMQLLDVSNTPNQMRDHHAITFSIVLLINYIFDSLVEAETHLKAAGHCLCSTAVEDPSREC